MAHQPIERYTLKEHPNGHYWKIKDNNTGKEYAKKEAIELLNNMEEEMDRIRNILSEPVYLADSSEVFSNKEFNIEHHTIHSLLMKQADRINELEQMLDDAEYEIEEIEQENRRLKCSQ